MAASENEILGDGGVVGAEGEGGVVHVAVEEYWVVFAGGAYGGDVGVDE